MRFKLYTKFVLTLVLISVIPLTILGSLLININQRGIQAAVLELHYKLAEKIANNTDNYSASMDDRLHFAVQILQKNVDWAEKQSLLQTFIETQKDIDSVSIVANSGKEALKVFSPSMRKPDAQLNNYGTDTDFIRARSTLLKTARVEIQSGAPKLVFYYPVSAGFVIRAEAEFKTLWEQIRNERVGGTGYALLVDKNGMPFVYPETRIAKSLLSGVHSWPIVKDSLKALGTGSSEFKNPENIAFGNEVILVQFTGALFKDIFKFHLFLFRVFKLILL